MSDFPFKKGDLIEIKSSITYKRYPNKQGVIVEDKGDGWFDVLVGDVVERVHRNYIVTPRIQNVKMTGGLK